MSDDFSIWEELKKTVRPLGFSKAWRPVSPKLKVRRIPCELMSTLDLHGMSFQDAYDAFIQFLQLHKERNSSKIVIITGRGKEGQGLIHREFPLWLDTPVCTEIVRSYKWLRGDGSVELLLKRKKKK